MVLSIIQRPKQSTPLSRSAALDMKRLGTSVKLRVLPRAKMVGIVQPQECASVLLGGLEPGVPYLCVLPLVKITVPAQVQEYVSAFLAGQDLAVLIMNVIVAVKPKVEHVLVHHSASVQKDGQALIV